MRDFVKSLSNKTEFVLVLLLAFGISIYHSLLAFFYYGPNPYFSDAVLYSIVVHQLAVLIVLLPFLRLRGWDWQRIGLRPNIYDTLIGVALTIGSLAAYNFFLFITLLFYTETESLTLESEKLSLLPIIAVSIINPFFEEIFVCGFIITSLKKEKGIWVAINVSIFVRLLYHLYQGVIGIISIIPIGIIFSYWYARTGRLWPVIVAHALLDFIGLFLLSGF